MSVFERYAAGDIVICKPGHEGLGKVWNETGGWEQWEGGPLMVVIGRETTNAKCCQLAERFSLDAGGLMGYRDSDMRGHYVVGRTA